MYLNYIQRLHQSIVINDYHVHKKTSKCTLLLGNINEKQFYYILYLTYCYTFLSKKKTQKEVQKSLKMTLLMPKNTVILLRRNLSYLTKNIFSGPIQGGGIAENQAICIPRKMVNYR